MGRGLAYNETDLLTPMADTLTVTDNRTGKTYEIPITEGAIKATDLKKIKTEDADDEDDG